MRGQQSVEVQRTNNRTFTAKYDIPGNEDLYIRFSLQSDGFVIDEENIKLQIVENVLWDIGKSADASTIISFVKSISSDYIITGMNVSKDGLSWLEIEQINEPQNRFLNNISRITIL